MKKLISLLLASVICVSLFAGCSSSSSTATEETTASTDSTATEETTASAEENSLEGKKIAVIFKQQAEQYWQICKIGAEEAADTYNVQVDTFAPVEANNNEQQLQLIQEAIAKQYDVICVAPCDSEGVIPAIEEANDAGIPVISFMTQIIGDVDVLSYISVDNYDAQYKITKALCEELQSGEVIILEGPAGQQTSTDKTNGAVDAIAEYDDIEIYSSQIADWSRSTAYTVMQNMLQANPNIKGVAACNDSMAMGAIQAIEEAGMAGEILVCGMNCDADALLAVQSGSLTVDLDNAPYDLGTETVAAAVDVLNGETLDEIIYIDTVLVTIDNVDEIIEKIDSYNLG